MALIERLMGLEEPKIRVHIFYSVLAERKRNKLTNPQVIAAFGGLSGAEQTEILALWNLINANTITAAEVDDVLIMAEGLTPPYNTAALVRTRLGLS